LTNSVDPSTIDTLAQSANIMNDITKIGDMKALGLGAMT